MLVIIHFQDHTKWSDERIAKNQSRIIEYCKERKLNYLADPSLDCYEGEHAFYEPLNMFEILVDVSGKADFLEFCHFVTEELRASPDVIHIPYQTLCVNGKGNFEVQVELFEINDFVESIWGKQIKLPKIDAEPP